MFHYLMLVIALRHVSVK